MTIKKLISRIAIIGLVQAGIVVVILAASSSTQMSAQEASTILLPEPPPIELVQPAPSTVPEDISDFQRFTPSPVDLELSGVEAGVRSGDFVGRGPFSIAGSASIITDEFGRSTLVFSEDFQVNRGQRLVVLLQTDNGKNSFELGELRAQGAQSFEVPFLNLNVFDEVVIYDAPFSTEFGVAQLSLVDAA